MKFNIQDIGRSIDCDEGFVLSSSLRFYGVLVRILLCGSIEKNLGSGYLLLSLYQWRNIVRSNTSNDKFLLEVVMLWHIGISHLRAKRG